MRNIFLSSSVAMATRHTLHDYYYCAYMMKTRTTAFKVGVCMRFWGRGDVADYIRSENERNFVLPMDSDRIEYEREGHDWSHLVTLSVVVVGNVAKGKYNKNREEVQRKIHKVSPQESYGQFICIACIFVMNIGMHTRLTLFFAGNK